MMNWRSYTALYLICVSTFWIVRWIQNVSVLGGIVFLLIGLIILFSERTDNRSHRIKMMILYICAGLITYISLCFFDFIFSNVRNIPAFGPVLVFLFRLLGYAATSQHGILLISDEGTSYDITIDAEKLGLIHGSALIVTFVFLSIFLRPNATRIILFSLMSLLFLCIRFVLLIILYLFSKSFSYELEHLSIFWSIPFLILTFIPLIVLSRYLLIWRSPDFSKFHFKKTMIISGAFLIAFACLQIAIWFDLPGERKKGRVLLDDYYSDVWETSAQEFSTSQYGRESVYNMYMGRKYLEHFYDVRVNTKPLSQNDLRDVDVLIIKTPIYRFSDVTADAIEDFVRRGGGLLLIGDHTDLMGMTSHLNDLSKRFGITYQFDATYDLTTGHDNHSESIELFRSPVSSSLAGVRMMTTCTMQVTPFLVRPITWVRNSIADEADYSRPSFFGAMEIDLSDEFGCFILGSARGVGDGKVAAICESTIFSNFGVFTSDREEWLRKLVELVNHRVNPMEQIVRIASLIFFFLFFIIGCWLLRPNLHAWSCIVVTFSIVAGLWIGIKIVDLFALDINMRSPHSPIPWMYFQRNGTTFNLPDAMAHYHADDADAFETIYVNVARVGYIPHEIPSISSAGDKNAPLVLIRPNRAAFSDTLLNWIASGGKALIVVKDSLGIKELPSIILPREQELHVNQDSVSVRYVYHGKGRIAYISPAIAFSRIGIGNNMNEPTAGAKSILETLYQSIHWLMSNE